MFRKYFQHYHNVRETNHLQPFIALSITKSLLTIVVDTRHAILVDLYPKDQVRSHPELELSSHALALTHGSNRILSIIKTYA